MFNPSMMDEMVFSQFPGINDAGKEGLELMHFVFGMLSLSMVATVIIALTIKVKESAQTALILSVIHIDGWFQIGLVLFLETASPSHSNYAYYFNSNNCFTLRVEES